MRLGLAVVLIALCWLMPVARAYVPSGVVTGNDTGGIIPWSPEVEPVYRDIAAAYCARWYRVARINSVHRRYGDFVGFSCMYDRRYDPRKAWWFNLHG